MPKIILLTQPECVAFLVPGLRAAGVDVEVAVEREDLTRAMSTLSPQTRLVSFAAKVIVPAAVLGRFAGPAYNFHPGSPEYPGLFPSVHALYDGQSEFAVTLHEMAPQVDSGPIIAAERFPIPSGANRLVLDQLTLKMMVAAFERWAPSLAAVATPLPRSGESWRGPRRTRADFNALCDLGESPTAEEFARRLRAVGEGPEHALTLTGFGRRFSLVSDAAGPVVRGGLKVS
ncbi:MAG: hypothetical protein EPO08_08040 [Rhodospirillaceae bacterium]|nr:MAG: hypothetical protein EPO08_08040 [Rhodospirillaceae bacterium]